MTVGIDRRAGDAAGDELGAFQLGSTVVVEAEPPAALEGEALDGWEIGVCTAALGAGAADVLGVDPLRVARVAEVIARLAAPAPATATAPEAAS